MTEQTPYMKSNFERRENDFYPTIDSRCVDALLEHFGRQMIGCQIVDVCADQGSGIVDYLKSLEYNAVGIADAFQYRIPGAIVVTNPPYTRSEVKPIMLKQIERVSSGELGTQGLAAFLLRTRFDHGGDYAEMFDSPHYRAQIKMRFRVWWTDSREVAPFHDFVWHVWTYSMPDKPSILYYSAPYDPRYAVQPNGEVIEPPKFSLYLSHYPIDSRTALLARQTSQHVKSFKTKSGAIKRFRDSIYRHAAIVNQDTVIFTESK